MKTMFKMKVTLWITPILTQSHFTNQTLTFFFPHVFFKSNKLKFILEHFSNFKSFESKKKNEFHCLIAIQYTFLHKKINFITIFVNRVFGNGI
jgi:hypothetical protein